MKHLIPLFVGLVMASQAASAEIVIANRTIRAQTVLAYQDMSLATGEMPGALTAIEDAEGQEARVTLYAGRPIRMGDVGPPALIERNQIVTLFYMRNGLRIATEARALARAAEGDDIRVMNLSSRVTLNGRVDHHGRVVVGPSNDLLADLEKN